ncbi:hypothetical protein [Paenibacillus sp. OV219]|uniref:hypothetical protein n=1 Tax=Paenibacillus sp. OV219 TaxID=1884377 RepID=UPI0008C2E2DB|nr:hypothetical protein [Paenibacillus sp. OV219]SEP17364.1 hypothetical protein SAMN05518847_1255 [Paenibacillus sp. OV219]
MNDDNVIQFRPKQAAVTEADRIAKLTLWEKGFSGYVLSIGLQTIAQTSEVIASTQTSLDNMYRAIREMAEANYIKLTLVVTNELVIQRAFMGHEARLAEIIEAAEVGDDL